MASQKFPPTIYITRESDTDGSTYFVVHTDAQSATFAESTPVAVYDFVSMGAVEVKREFRFGSLKNAQKAATKRTRK